MRGLFLSLLLLTLTGCQRGPWKHTVIQSSQREYDMARLTYPPTTPYQGIELELSRVGENLQGFINVHAFELPPLAENSQETQLQISDGHKTKTFILPLYQGGQRARLTENCLETLLEMLHTEKALTLTAGHFIQTIDSSRFKRHFEELMREPSRILPQNLITFEIF
ncbi:MAG: hypothetical protein KDK60_03890 [Chlamydiia bacterium]|nr:hypothetical protein [Chlamydiia bacterium]